MTNDYDTENWLGVMEKLGEKSKKDRERRISEWATLAGPPHAEVLLGDDPRYMDRIGFWRVHNGIIRIRASKKGKFDPAERTDIDDQEIKAIIQTFHHPAIKGK